MRAAERLIMAAVKQGAAVDRSARLWSATTPGATQFLHRTSVDQYELVQPIGGGRYWQQQLRTLSGLPGAKTPIPHQMNNQFGVIPVLTKGESDASFVRTGAGWGKLGLSGTYDGSYYRTTVAGDSVLWTSPVAVSTIYLRYAALTNIGLARVELDGSRTAAVGCTTAQALVDTGTYPSTILVANGGTLNPTDRVVDQYGNAQDVFQPIADGLAETVHTVNLICTGYKRAAATDFRIDYTGMSYGSSAITPATASATLYNDHDILFPSNSAFEYAYQTYPTGGNAADSTWAGNVHGWEDETGLTISVDGGADIAGTMTDGQWVSGSSIVVSKSTRLYHSDVGAGATPTCLVTTTYTLDDQGLTVAHTDTWQADMTMTIGYPGMYPTEAETGGPTMGATSASGATSYSLTNANGAFVGAALADTVWMWTPASGGVAGHYGAIMRMPAASSPLGPNASPDFTFLEDRAITGATLIKKAYFTLQSQNNNTKLAIASGTVNNWSITYRLAWVPDADATFG